MKIAVAMSGGIDSSIAAILLKESGHDIVGIHSIFFSQKDNEDNQVVESLSLTGARDLAHQYKFPFYVVDLRNEFSQMIVKPFCNAYLEGKTPNPCIECNVLMKFGRLYEFAKSIGCERIATGHYVKLKNSMGRYYIAKSDDTAKDQSYFLYRLTQQQLAYTVFPLGNSIKSDVKLLAKNLSLPVSEKPESQEICFIPDNRYVSFIEKNCNVPQAGSIINKKGNIIGIHKGIHRYTIGQRRGLGISSDRPLYVVSIDGRRNEVVAGYKEDLAIRHIVASNIVHMKTDSLNGMKVLIKTRSTQKPTDALLEEKKDIVIATFSEPQYGVSLGQSAVFYDEQGDVLGGGYIAEAY